MALMLLDLNYSCCCSSVGTVKRAPWQKCLFGKEFCGRTIQMQDPLLPSPGLVFVFWLQLAVEKHSVSSDFFHQPMQRGEKSGWKKSACGVVNCRVLPHGGACIHLIPILSFNLSYFNKKGVFQKIKNTEG